MPVPIVLPYLLGPVLAGSGPTGPGPAPPPAEDVFAAFVAWWKSSDDLAERVPGGLLNAMAPASVVLPFARMSDVEPNVPISLDDTEFEVVLSVYGRGDSETKANGRAVVRDVLDMTARSPLRFLDEFGSPWRESSVRRTGTGTLSVAWTEGEGQYVWRYDQPIRFTAVAESALDLDE